jgi:hypothetical protein
LATATRNSPWIHQSFSWRRFDFNFFFQGSYGNDIYNATRIDLEGMFDSKNQSSDVLRRWTPDNRNTDIPRAVGGGKVDNVRNSTRFVEDGSYLRLKSVTLSYNFNPKTVQKGGHQQTFRVHHRAEPADLHQILRLRPGSERVWAQRHRIGRGLRHLPAGTHGDGRGECGVLKNLLKKLFDHETRCLFAHYFYPDPAFVQA